MLEDIKQKRFLFLKTLCEVTEANIASFVNMWELGNELGLQRKDISNIVQYLNGEGLVKYMAVGGGISITHSGIKQLERAITESEKPSQHFPAVQNVIHVHSMTNSQIQQGSNRSTQSQSISQQNAADLSSFISELKSKLDELKLSIDDREDVEADIATIEAQMSAKRPKQTVVSECLKTIRNILEGTTGSIVATGLLAMMPTVAM